MMRRTALGALALGLTVRAQTRIPAACATAERRAVGWTAWHDFRRDLLSDDGRVIDAQAEETTTSEGQAYALFFALVANDRDAFDLLLRWTEDNLADGDLSARLPAWQWGRRQDGSWGVRDRNPASDADLWMAYVLTQAGRLWGARRYRALADLLLRRIQAEEVIELPGLGATLLPGPIGFRLSERSAKLNPSYLPLPVLRWFARHRPEPVWTAVLQSSVRLLHESAPHGSAPNWVVYDTRNGWSAAGLSEAERRGSYDAIRVYLWLGLADAAEPERAALLQRHAPMARLVATRGAMPEQVDPGQPLATQTGADGPFGFQAAMVPFLDALGDTATATRLADRVAAQRAAPGASPPSMTYYSQALSLFALGFRERRYRFAADGALAPNWASCDTSAGS